MNYQTCSLEELADHIDNNTVAAITQRIIYYQKKGDLETVGKIRKARLLSKQRKIAKEIEGM